MLPVSVQMYTFPKEVTGYREFSVLLFQWKLVRGIPSPWSQHPFPLEQNLWHWPDLDCSFSSPRSPLMRLLALSLGQFADKAVTDTSCEEGHSHSSAFLSMIKLILWPDTWPHGPFAHQRENGICSIWENKHEQGRGAMSRMWVTWGEEQVMRV